MQNFGAQFAGVVVHDVIGAQQHFDVAAAPAPVALGATAHAFERQAGDEAADFDVDGDVAAEAQIMCTMRKVV